MRHTLSDRSMVPDGADTPDDQPSPATAPPPRAALPHWQARRRLALLLDGSTDSELAGRLRRHLADCARCQQEFEQLRQAEAWFLTQPSEIPQIAAQQDAAWAAIQARLTNNAVSLAAGAAHLANGAPAGAHCDHPAALEGELVPLPLASTGEEVGEADRLYRPLPVPQTPAPTSMASKPGGKSRRFNTRTALIATLAASFLVSGLAALVLARLPGAATPQTLNIPPTTVSGVLDPGDETPAFSFDPASRHLFALTGDLSYYCAPGMRCPPPGPPCLQLSMLDTNSGKTLQVIRPDCTQGKSTLVNGTTFLNLLDDSADNEMLLIDSHQLVQAVNSASGAIVGSYHLACCANNDVQPVQPLLDRQDHLLLTPARSEVLGVSDTLVAQDATSGQMKYQTALDTFQFGAALVSNVTGWLYLWSQCASNPSQSCVEVYDAKSGHKESEWPESFDATPLAADPTEGDLYVRADYPNGQSETLVVDGRSGEAVGHLPAAQAIAINNELHHLYLLGDDGVAVIDTRTRRKLSTLPVLAHDESWVAPAVDEQTSQVYLPIQRGRLLIAQDNAAGQLQMRSTALKVVLDAERAMTIDEDEGGDGLFPWELPIGPGTLTAYHPLSRGTTSNCAIGWVAAQSTATITPQSHGGYMVQFSLAWDDQFANTTSVTPRSQASYPHRHSWLYQVPASGGAQRTSDQGETMAQC